MRERGVDTCVMEVSSHALSQHRVDGVVYDVAAVHQPVPGPPGLPRHDGATTSRPRPRCSPRSARAAASSASTTSGAGELAAEATVPVDHRDLAARTSPPTGGSSPARATTGRLRPRPTAATGCTLRSALPGRLQPGQHRDGRARALLASGRRPTTTSSRAVAADPHVPGRMERVACRARGRDERPAGGRRLRPHRRMPWPRPCGALRPRRPGAAGRRPRCRWRPRPRQAGGDGARRGRRAPTSSSSPTTTPAPRTPPRSAPPSSPARAPCVGRRHAAGLHERRPDRAGRDRAAVDAGRRHAARAASSPSSARATRPARRSAAPSTPSTTATRLRAALTRAGPRRPRRSPR